VTVPRFEYNIKLVEGQVENLITGDSTDVEAVVQDIIRQAKEQGYEELVVGPEVEALMETLKCSKCGKVKGLLIKGKCIDCAPELFKLRR